MDFRCVLDRAASQYRLLGHPFYRAWLAGALTRADLADYAAQYRHVEQILPATLEATAAALPAGQARRLVESNLADELSRPRPHLELLDDFALAVGADTDSAASRATAHLVATYQDAAEEGPVAALAVIGAYEVQAAEVASSKAASLRTDYHLDSAGTQFWDVHARLEESHADWTAEAIEELSPAPEEVSRHAGASAAAWWAFLDEREAARPA
ncbi:MAG TPA: iron-containing redox enzyme family protein [Acidimicrobiales bacterium]|nr:iron-containing redox enzyme family protein [Acidimicrobiales bacterium]